MYVYDLDLFLTVQILEDTPAVLSLGKLCEDHGYSNELTSGQKTHLEKRQENTMQHGEIRAYRYSGACQQDLPGRLRVHPQRRYRKTQCVDGVHAVGHEETCCTSPQKPKTKNEVNDVARRSPLRDLPGWL